MATCDYMNKEKHQGQILVEWIDVMSVFIELLFSLCCVCCCLSVL